MRKGYNMFQELKKELEAAGISVQENESLKQHTSFKIGGDAVLFAEIASQQQLSKAMQLIAQHQVEYYCLGKGSNILFSDAGFEGIILHFGKEISDIAVDGETIRAMSGASLQQVCLQAQKAGLTGLEFAYGIPGSIGGAVYMNAGAYGGEMKDVVVSVECVDQNGMVHTISGQDLQMGYRTSCFEKNGWCILSATMRLQKGDPQLILDQMQDYMSRRKEKQPLDKPSAGSAFKRPQGAYASALIDECQLKGYRVGDAAISEKHAGFIVNLGNASCADVLQVAEDVSRIVKEKTGFLLEKEIRVVGKM